MGAMRKVWLSTSNSFHIDFAAAELEVKGTFLMRQLPDAFHGTHGLASVYLSSPFLSVSSVELSTSARFCHWQ